MLLAQYKANWIALVEEYKEELLEFATSTYDKDTHGGDAWFEYIIEDVDVDINVYVEDELVYVTIYPIEGCSTVTNMQVSL